MTMTFLKAKNVLADLTMKAISYKTGFQPWIMGSKTIIMANAYPKSTFMGFDYHQPSIEKACKKATKSGLGNNVRFEIASSAEFLGDDFDLVTFFDCFHDMGNPLAVAKNAREALKQRMGLA